MFTVETFSRAKCSRENRPTWKRLPRKRFHVDRIRPPVKRFWGKGGDVETFPDPEMQSTLYGFAPLWGRQEPGWRPTGETFEIDVQAAP